MFFTCTLGLVVEEMEWHLDKMEEKMFADKRRLDEMRFEEQVFRIFENSCESTANVEAMEEFGPTEKGNIEKAMSPALLLLILTLFGQSQPARGDLMKVFVDVVDALGDYAYYDYTEEPAAAASDYDLSWLSDLLDENRDDCEPNPCENNGTCEVKANGGYKCLCVPTYRGKHCEIYVSPCKKGNCGRGECVLIKTAPFYECKCTAPFRPPDCRKAAACKQNPCLNGGSCQKGRTRSQFTCLCPLGYSGKLCQVGPDDCYEGDGQSYQGFVSETMDGHDCLPWNSHLMRDGGFDLDTISGLGPHSYCRNPDGEDAPWCFIKIKKMLDWNFCNVTRCSGTTALPMVPVTPEIVNPLGTQAPSTQPFAQCGKPQPSAMTPRIFGGHKVMPATHPWQVSLQVRRKRSRDEFGHTCGGILIDSCWVLTAAHCINRMMEMQVEVGGIHIEKKEDSEQIIPVEDFIVHENYKETKEALFNDIALLRLKGPEGQCARETRFVKTACLPSGPLPDSSECYISGWGETETEYYSTRLLAAKVRLISQERCTAPQVYGDRLDDSMICAGRMQGAVDTCQGDSGGPLVCQKDGVHYVYGVVSWGDACGLKNKPGVYARVTKFVDWINSNKQKIKM
ncbi:hyaluronan-binding protein 2-like isoform X2 [Alosa sapidissima]|uniref:hyaluronan-binding protein 2-like isoform X2 n=1 Tax=Alosa sapidissima TaxID=34773 RepID=UPI001C0876F9|nr:hyaluronan-binding protein 2-like isoform X2 [Alosa sapidissima]